MPRSFQVISGANQTATTGTDFAAPVVVRAFQANGQPFGAGEPVVWSVPLVPAGTPSGRFAGATTLHNVTDASGFVDTGVVTAVTAAGGWTGLVQFENELTASINWSLANQAPDTVINFVAGTNNQAVAINGAFAPIQTLVSNTLGPRPGLSVLFSAPAGSGTFAGGGLTASAITNASGVANSPVFTASATPGAFAVTVSVPANASIPAVHTTWSKVDPAIPTTVQAQTGGGQQAAVSTAFAQPLQVRVLNGLGLPVSGVTVTFTSPAAGASCTFAALRAATTAVSNASGFATSSLPSANATPGSYFVTATVPGATGAQFQLTNGSSYLPEVCTVNTVPSGTSQPVAGSAAWINTGNAISGTVGASTSPGAGQGSAVMLCSPLPAGVLSPIDDGAKITKIVALFDVKSTFSAPASNFADVTVQIRNGANARWAAQTAHNTLNNSFQPFTFTFTATGSTTGAQFKSGDWGVGFLVDASGGSYGTNWVRNVKFRVCYQNPDTPAISTVTVPLLFCEA